MQAEIEVFVKVEFSRKYTQFKQFEYLLIYNRKNTLDPHIIFRLKRVFSIYTAITLCIISNTNNVTM